jgi:hypothetical protein
MKQQDDVIPYKHIDITPFQSTRLIRWCNCTSKPIACSDAKVKGEREGSEVEGRWGKREGT